MGNYLYTANLPFDNICLNGWRRDYHDSRDHKYVSRITLQEYHTRYVSSLSLNMPPIINQGNLGSCTANGIATAIRFCEIKEKLEDTSLRSRLFIYYNEREMEGTVSSDAGAQIRDGIKSINKVGACSEELYPYDISVFTQKPPEECYTEAKKHRVLKYERVNQKLDDIKSVLKEGYPIVFGFAVYNSIRNPDVIETGEIPDPVEGDQMVGGHCVILCGFDDEKKKFEIQNSWGEEWGNKGHGYLSYDYILNSRLASDFWYLRFTK